MDNSAVTLATGGGAANAPAPPVRVVPSGKAAPPESPTPPQADRQSEADFLAHRALGTSNDASGNTYARFIVDPKSHDVHVEIIDASKHEVVRTIPGDDLRRLAQDYRASNGLVLDSTA